jgi:VCBS repeat-containing protein
MKGIRTRSASLRMALEPRLMFDGAAVVTADAALAANNSAAQPAADQPGDAHHEPGQHEPGNSDAQHSPHDAPGLNEALAATPPPLEGPARHEIYFVDASLPDRAQLTSQLPDQAVIVYLDSNRDGLAQISTALQGKSDIDAIHLITHGTSGTLLVGSSQLDAQSIQGEYQAILNEIGSHLAVDGDVLVYGCDLAAGDAGKETLGALAFALSADTAGSENATGAGDGDWVLEAHVGTIETTTFAAHDWDHQLLAAVPTADSATVLQNSSGNKITVLSNDVVLLGAVVNISTVSAPANGSVTINADKTLSYTPNAGYSGSDSFTYSLRDGGGLALGSATVSVTVNAIAGGARPTLALPSSVSLPEDSNVSFSTAAGRSIVVADSDSALLKVTLSVPAGTFSLATVAGLTFTQGDGTNDSAMILQGSAANINAALNGLVYTPVADFNGSVNLGITVTDNISTPVTSSVAMNFAAVGDSTPDSVSTVQNTAASFNLLTNDSFENPARTVTAASTPAHGTVTVDAQGNAIYTPVNGYVGSDSFTYTVSSGGVTETQTVSVNVTGTVPPLGVSVPAAQAFAEDVVQVFSAATGNTIAISGGNSEITVSLLVNNGTLTLSQVTGLAFISGDGVGDAAMVFKGSASAINAALDGLRFTPTADYNGAATLTLQATDGISAAQNATVAMALSAVADGVADSVQTAAITPVTFSPLANDNFEGAASVTAVGSASHGTVSRSGNSITYTPALGYTGADSFTYTVTSGGVTEQVAVNVTVGAAVPVNNAPVASSLGSATAIDGGLVLIATGTAFSDPDVLDLLTYSATGLPPGLSISATTGLITGVLGTHASTVSGGLYTVAVTATDLAGAKAVSQLNLQVLNPAPIPLLGLSVGGTQDTLLNLSASLLAIVDPDGDSIAITQASALHGTVTIKPDGSLTYTPNSSYFGLDTVTYTVTDADGASATGYIAVTLAATPALPTLILPSLPLLNEDTPLIFANLLGQQLSVGDINGQILDLRLSVPVGSFTLTETGGLTISEGDGTNDSTLRISGTAADINAALAKLIYTPGADYNGQVKITLELGQLLGGILNVTALLPIDIAPVADIVNDSISTTVGVGASFNVLANDSFENSGRVVQSHSTPGHGLLSLDAQGNATYTPNSGFIGTDTFTYTVLSNGTLETAIVTITIGNAPNQSPTASLLANSSALDGQTLQIAAGAAFSDPDGDALTYSATGLPAGFTINPATGLISGTLDGHASTLVSQGLYNIVISASDGRGASVSQGFVLAVSNPPPIAGGDNFASNENVPVSGNLLGNDSDPDGDSLSISTTPVQAPTHGVLVLQANGTFTYTPAPGYNGTDSFVYRVIDSDGGTSTATVILTIAAVNDVPTTSAPITNQNTTDAASYTLNVAGNFADPDGDTLGYSATGLPAGLTISASGQISGTLARDASQGGPNANGVYTVVVTARDPGGAQVSQTFILNVSNPAPTTQGVSVTTAEDTPVNGTLLANDIDGDALAFSVTQNPAHGTLVLNANGTYTYTPAANYNGVDSFTYQVRDADGALATAVVSLTVTAVNDAPNTSGTIAPQNANDGAGYSLSTAGNFADVDGDTLSYSASGLPSGLSIDANGVITGTLANNASQQGPNGNGIYSVVVTATDANGLNVTQTFTLNVSNPAPVTSGISITTAEDTPISGALVATDIDGDSVTFSATQNPANGTLVLNSNGSYTYTPNANYNGPDSFTYQVTDADGAVVTAVVSLVVTAVNDAPNSVGSIATQAANDGAAFSLGTAANFADLDGDALSYNAVGLPAGLSIDANGLITGTLANNASQQGPNGNGIYSVVVTATDANGLNTSQTFTLNVSNPAPVTSGISITTAEDTPISGALVATDVDGDSVTFSATQNPANGTLVLNSNGTYTYTPNANYNGPDSFTYQVTDADGAVVTAVVSLVVTAVNDAPNSVGSIATQTANDGAAFTLGTSANFTDLDGDVLSYTAAGLPAGLSIDANGLITGTLANNASQQGPNGNGIYSVVVTATDASGLNTSQTFTLNVSNPAPVTSGISVTTAEDTPISGALVATDIDGDALTFSATQNPTNGTLVLNSNGTYTYTPNANYNGPDSFTYQVTDADGAVVTAVVSLVVTAVNDAPNSVGSIATQAANDGAAFTLGTAANFTDLDGDVLSYNAFGLPAGLSIDANGLITGTLANNASQQGPNNNGIYSVVVTATDANGLNVSQTFTLNVSNPAPATSGISVSTAEDTPVNGTLIATDIDGDALTFSATQNPANGTLVLNSNGTYTYTPNANYNGPDSFTYQVTDADGAVGTAVVSLVVTAVNDAPNSVGSIATQATNDGAAFTLGTAASFTDLDGDALSYTAAGLPAGLSIDANGLITGTLANNASQQGPNGNGIYSVVVTATDVNGLNTSQTFTLNVSNPAPVTSGISVTTVEDTPISGALVATDIDGDSVTFSATQNPANGTLVLNTNGTYTYTPNANYNGPDSFTYQVTDADGAVVTAIVNLVVTAANDAPNSVGSIATQAANDGAAFTLGTAANFTDLDGDVLSYNAVGLPAGLSIDANGLITGTLANNASQQGANNNGIYSVVVTATDANGLNVSQTFTLNVSNPAPVTSGISVSTAEDTPVNGTLIATDIDGDALTFSATQNPANGTLVLNSNGTYTYTPNANYNGPDSFTYQVTDADGAVVTAVVSLVVTAVNDAPNSVGSIATQTANDGAAFTLGTSANFTDLDGDVLSYTAAGLPAGLSIDANGLITGTLANNASQQGPNGNGIYSVVVTATDATGLNTSQTFTLNVSNPAPVTSGISITTAEDTPISGALVATDIDGDSVTFSATQNPANGTLVLNSNGTYTYTPNANFNGTDSFTYQVTDADGAVVTAVVSLVVTAVNDAPNSVGSIATQAANDGAAFTLGTAANFTDLDGDVLSYTAAGLPAGLSIDANGVITGTLANNASQQGPNSNGIYSVVVTATDANGLNVSQTFTLNVSNPAPVTSGISVSTAEDIPVNGTLIATDIDGDALTFSATQNPANGTLVLNSNGTYTYTPNANFNGTDSFTYQVTDADGAVVTAIVNLVVTAANDAPNSVGSIATQAANDGAAFTLGTAANFADLDGDVLSYNAVGLPAGLSIDANGLITGTLANNSSQQGPNGNGIYSVVVTATDANGLNTSQTFNLNVSNPAPVTSGISITTAEDTTVNATLIATDIDGDALTFSATQNPANGTLILNSNGTYTYTPNANYNGPDSFTYQVTDADGGVVTAIVNLVVTAVNDAPNSVGSIAAQTGNDGAAFTLGTAANFTDLDGDVLFYTAAGLPAGLSIDANGLITGTLANNASQQGANNNGIYSVVVTATDANGLNVSQTFTLNVSNPAPVTSGISITTAEDTAISGALVATDIDGDSVTFSATQNPANGTLVLNSNGTYTYTPNANYNGPDSFTYQVTDADGAVVTAVVSLVVTAVNDAPNSVGTIATQAANDGAAFSLGTAANFTDLDGDALSYNAVGLPAGLIIDANGVITGTLANNASQQGPSNNGIYSVVLTATDANGLSVSQTFTFNVSNPAPVTSGISITTAEDTPISGALVATDIDGDSVTFSATQNPTNGTLVLNSNGTYTYTPNANFNGTDSFTYQVTDADGAVVTAIVNLVVTAVNDAPNSVGSIATQAANDGAAFTLGTAANFADLDGDVLSYNAVGLPAGLSIDANGLITGTLANNSSQQGPNGNGIYSVVVTATDANGLNTSQTFTMNVSNPAPVTSGISVTTAEDTAISGALVATDIDGDSVTFSATQNPANGTLVLNSNGTYTYTPNANYNGPDSFTYQVTDADGAVVTAVVSLVVTAVNDAPNSVGSIATQAANDGAAFTLGTAANFTDLDGDVLSYNAVGLPAGLSIDANGLITGTLANNASQQGPNNNGIYSVVVTATDANGLNVSQTFTLNVSNPAPVTSGISITTAEDTPISGALVATDIDGDALTFSATQNPTNGTLVLNSNGTYTYTPNANYNGPDSFTYQVTDADGAVVTAVVSLVVTAVNDAPNSVGSIATQAANDGAAFTLGTSANFTDLDVDVLSYTAAGLPAGLSIDANGLITGTLANNASQQGPNGNGIYSVVVTATDANGLNVTQTFTLNVSNPAPVTSGISITTAEDTPISGALVATDVDGDSVTFSATQNPANGTLVLNSNGTYTYTPNANFIGTDSFTYQVTDADGAVVTAVVSLVVTAVNDAPNSVGSIATQAANDGAAFSLGTAANFIDLDGDVLSYTVAGLPAGLSIDANGLITGTLANNASQQGPNGNGIYSVVVTATDANGLNTSQAFILNVSNPAPTTAGSTITTAEDTVINGTLVATDIDGDTLTFSATQNPTNGTLVLNSNGTYTYTPNANYNGPDSFTYQVTDADGAVVTAIVNLVVTAVNDAPSSVGTIATQAASDGAAFSLGTAANFADLDGDALSYTAAGLPAGLSIDANGLITGTLANNASQQGPNGNGIYSVVVTATDANGLNTSQTFNLNVSNPAPVTSGISITTAEDTPISGALIATDVDGDALTFSATQNPTNGTLVLNSNGTYTYTPNANYNGPDSFTYQVTDADGAVVTAVVSLVVTAVNDAPNSVGTIATQGANDGAAFSLGTAANFTDLDGDALSYNAVGLPAGLSIDANGLITGTLTNNASQQGPNGNGIYSVVVTATDANGLNTSQTFTLNVSNPAPVTSGISITTAEDTPISGALVATDIDGDSVTFSATQNPANGTLVLNSNGTYTYTPNANYSGADSFTYQVVDADGGVATATVSLVIGAVNNAPTPVGTIVSQAVNDGAGFSLATAGNFADQDGDALAYTATGLPAGLSIDANGLITGTLAGNASQQGPNNNGIYSVVVTATDANGLSTSQTFTLNASNPAPVTSGLSVTTPADTAVNGALVATDTDGDSLAFSVTQSPANGTVVLNGDGTFVYVPNPNYSGPDSFTYQVADADGATTFAVVSLTVNAANNATAPVPTPASTAGTATASDGGAAVAPPVTPVINIPGPIAVAPADPPPASLLVASGFAGSTSPSPTLEPFAETIRPMVAFRDGNYDPVILDAVNGVKRLDGLTTLSSARPMQDFVQGLSPLSSSTEISAGGAPVSEAVGDLNEVNRQPLQVGQMQQGTQTAVIDDPRTSAAAIAQVEAQDPAQDAPAQPEQVMATPETLSQQLAKASAIRQEQVQALGKLLAG